LATSSIAEAARQAQVPERTLHGWLSGDAAFKAQYHDLKARLVHDVLQRLLRSATKAVETLEELIGEGEKGPGRRAAVHDLITVRMKVREHAELDVRLKVLEQRFDAQEGVG